MKHRHWIMAVAILLTGAATIRPVAANPVLLEMFTSQGCSSCPPADALMAQLAADPDLIILSYHIDYWNSLGWTDPYASASSTTRQYAYSKALGLGGVFTPQLIVNGTKSMVGSQENQVRASIDAAKKITLPVRAVIAPQPSGFTLTLSGDASGTADIWEASFVSHAVTDVKAGENGGSNLESINNVTSWRKIGVYDGSKTSFNMSALQAPDDGLAVLIQQTGQGKILGAAAYIKK